MILSKLILILSLILTTLILDGCASAPQLIARDYSSSRALLRDYLKVPKLETATAHNEVSPDQKTYTITYRPEKLPNDIAFEITNEWELTQDGRLAFLVSKNSTHPSLGAESLILKEFFDSLFTFTDSPEQGLDFFTRILLGEIDAIEEHVKRRLKNIDFQPAAALLDDYYPNTHLPALRSVLSLTAKWRRFEQNKKSSFDGEKVPTWAEVVASWIGEDDLRPLQSFINSRALSPSVHRYFELMLKSKDSVQEDFVLMFYPVQESKQEDLLLAEGIEEQSFHFQSKASLIDLVKEQNDMENTSMFLPLYTTLGQASRYGAWGVAAVWVRPELLLPQNQGLFSQNKWLYPIGIKENSVYFKATPKDLRLSKDKRGEPRLSYFTDMSQKVKVMQSFESADEFKFFARSFWLKYYSDLVQKEVLE